MQNFADFSKFLKELANTDHLLSNLYRLSDLHGQELDMLAEVWDSFETERRRAIVSRLVEIAEVDFQVDFVQVFKIALRDDDAKVRVSAIEGLWENEDVALLRPLLDLLVEDPSVLVREAAAISVSRFALQAELGRLQPRLANLVWKALWDKIHDLGEDINVRRRAIESLAYFDRPEVRPIIKSAYEDGDTKMRVSALFAMGRSADDTWSDVVLSDLEQQEPEIRYEATRACGALKLIEAVPALSLLVADSDPEVKLAAVWSLGQIGVPEAKRVLEICCQEGDEAVRDAAEDALSELDFMQGDLDFPLYDFDMEEDDQDADIWEQEGWEDEEEID